MLKKSFGFANHLLLLQLMSSYGRHFRWQKFILWRNEARNMKSGISSSPTEWPVSLFVPQRHIARLFDFRNQIKSNMANENLVLPRFVRDNLTHWVVGLWCRRGEVHTSFTAVTHLSRGITCWQLISEILRARDSTWPVSVKWLIYNDKRIRF